MRKTEQANLCTVWIAALTLLHLWRVLVVPPLLPSLLPATRARNAVGAAASKELLRGFVSLQCPENRRFLLPAGSHALLAGGTAEMPLSQLAFEVVRTPSHPGWIALRCVENGLFVELLPPSEALDASWKCLKSNEDHTLPNAST